MIDQYLIHHKVKPVQVMDGESAIFCDFPNFQAKLAVQQRQISTSDQRFCIGHLFLNALRMSLLKRTRHLAVMLELDVLT